MIISVAIITAGPQLTKAANQSSGLRKMLLSSCMAPSSTKADCQRKLLGGRSSIAASSIAAGHRPYPSRMRKSAFEPCIPTWAHGSNRERLDSHKKTDSAFVCLLATATTGVVGFRPSPRPRYVAGIVRSYSTAKLFRWALTTSPISTVCTPVFAHADAAETWFAENDPEGVALSTR
jgi:hypothetical protein